MSMINFSKSIIDYNEMDEILEILPKINKYSLSSAKFSSNKLKLSPTFQKLNNYIRFIKSRNPNMPSSLFKPLFKSKEDQKEERKINSMDFIKIKKLPEIIKINNNLNEASNDNKINKSMEYKQYSRNLMNISFHSLKMNSTNSKNESYSYLNNKYQILLKKQLADKFKRDIYDLKNKNVISNR